MPDDTPATARPTKAYVLDKLLGSGNIVCVVLDARVPGVDVPWDVAVKSAKLL